MKLTTRQEVILIVLAVIAQRAIRGGWATKDAAMFMSGVAIGLLTYLSYLHLRKDF